MELDIVIVEALGAGVDTCTCEGVLPIGAERLVAGGVGGGVVVGYSPGRSGRYT